MFSELTGVEVLPCFPNLCYYRPLKDIERRHFESGDPTPGGAVSAGPTGERRHSYANPLSTIRGAMRLLLFLLQSILIQRRRLANGGAAAIEYRSDL
jgi:hypothetical protein